MNPVKFCHRKKLFNDILHEIFNVESNYRTELNMLNLKLLKKINDHRKKINEIRQEKLRQTFTSTRALKHPSNKKLQLKKSNSNDNLIIDKEEDTKIDKLISESLENLLKFYKTKHKLISKEVSNIGIVIYKYSSSHKNYDNYSDLKNMDHYQKDFEMNFLKLMTAKKNYFEKMNNFELFLHEEEENRKKLRESKKKENNQNVINDNKDKIDELIKLRKQYKKYLTEMTREQKTFISKINEIGNDIQDFNITENNLLCDFFKIFEENSENLLKEIKNLSILYQNNQKAIQDYNKELGNSLLFDERLYIGYKFEEYEPKFTDINNKRDLSVIEKMNKLIGFEFDKIKTNQSKNDNLADTIMYNDNLDDNLLFILLMDKFLQGENILNEKERQLMKNLFNQDKYIKEFLNKLNKIRSDRKIFNIKEKFEILKDFFNEINAKISFSDDKYHDLVNIIMILSETFYYKEEDKKIYLNKVMNVPKEIKDSAFWIKYITIEIENEYKKFENKKCEYIVLLSNTTHLKEFSLEEKILDEIIEYFNNKYKLASEEIQIVNDQLKK
jgi:hypothetical protein